MDELNITGARLEGGMKNVMTFDLSFESSVAFE
jgi:hypothetical protein